MKTDKNINILVVEDNEKIRTLLCSILKNIGFQNISEAENGKIAWDKIQAFDYNLVLTDWMMPEMDGLALLKTIRSHAEFKQLPVMMITASDRHESVLQAAQNGVSGYIVKPFSLRTIVDKIDAVFHPA